jgi:hypothetical protein
LPLIQQTLAQVQTLLAQQLTLPPQAAPQAALQAVLQAALH